MQPTSALLLSLAAAAAAETVEVTGGVRVQLAGQPTTLEFEFNDYTVHCFGSPIPDVLPSASFPCNETAYSFTVLTAPTPYRYTVEIRHKLDDDVEIAGEFLWGCNGPLPMVCSQVGLPKVDLV